jgi:hypothetical protein
MTTTTDPTALFGQILGLLETLPDPTDGTFDEVARRLDIADQIRLVLDDLIAGLQMEIAERMEDDTQVIAGIGQFTRRPKESSVWKDETSRERMFDDAKRAIAQKVARDPMTGELLSPLVMVARETFDLMEQVFSLGAQPKAAFKKALGLQPDEYRIKSRSGYTVKIDRGVEGDSKPILAEMPEPF